MLRLFIASFTALALGACGRPAIELPPQRPMAEMHGSCENFSWDLSHEFALWAEAPAEIAGARVSTAATAVPLGAPVRLALQSQADVQFAATPETDRGGPDRFAGMVVFTPHRDGVYRVSASSGVWIDAVQGGVVVPSARFEMQTGCDRIFKSIAYQLRGGQAAIIQINGSRTNEVRLLVSEWRE